MKSISEMSGTGGGAGSAGASFTPGVGEQYSTPKAFKKKLTTKKSLKLREILNELDIDDEFPEVGKIDNSRKISYDVLFRRLSKALESKDWGIVEEIRKDLIHHLSGWQS
jgi:hypothetical protein